MEAVAPGESDLGDIAEEGRGVGRSGTGGDGVGDGEEGGLVQETGEGHQVILDAEARAGLSTLL